MTVTDLGCDRRVLHGKQSIRKTHLGGGSTCLASWFKVVKSGRQPVKSGRMGNGQFQDHSASQIKLNVNQHLNQT